MTDLMDYLAKVNRVMIVIAWENASGASSFMIQSAIRPVYWGIAISPVVNSLNYHHANLWETLKTDVKKQDFKECCCPTYHKMREQREPTLQWSATYTAACIPLASSKRLCCLVQASSPSSQTGPESQRMICIVSSRDTPLLSQHNPVKPATQNITSTNMLQISEIT